MEMPTVQCDSKSPEAAVLPPAAMCLFACSDPVFAQAKSKSNEAIQQQPNRKEMCLRLGKQVALAQAYS